jgi:hypothetical protein
MDSARIVADHAAQRVVRVGSGIGTIGEVVRLGLFPQVIENEPRLYAGDFTGGIDLEDPVQVFRVVDDDRNIARLAAKAGSAAA